MNHYYQARTQAAHTHPYVTVSRDVRGGFSFACTGCRPSLNSLGHFADYGEASAASWKHFVSHACAGCTGN